MTNETPLPTGRVRTPMILQMEAAECGAAALAIILAYFGRRVPLATLRRDCGVSRDGSKLSNILKAAQEHGLEGKAYKRDISTLSKLAYPYVVFWNFNHFVVVEGFRRGRVCLNDPVMGPRTILLDEFQRSYTGVVLAFEPGPNFQRGGASPSLILALWRRLRGSLIPVSAAICTALLLVAPGLAVPALIAAFVDRVLVGGQSEWGRPLVLGMLLAAVFRAVIGALQFRILRRLQIRLAVANSSRFVKHLLRLPASYYAQRYAGEVSSRIALNDQVAEVLSGQLATTSIDTLMMIFYWIVMLVCNWQLTIVATVFAVVNFWIMRMVAKKRKESSVRLSMAQGRTTGVGLAGLQSVRTLKASGLESDFFSRWAGFFANMYNAQQELSATNYRLGVVPPLLSALMTASVLIAGGFEVMHGRMSIGLLVAFQSLATSFLKPVNALVSLGNAIQDLGGHLNRLDDVLSSPAPEEPAHNPDSQMPVRLRGHVEFRNVTFSYDPLSPPVVLDLSFEVRPGERIAFVGGSGSGKSTVIRLLAGLYTPLSGEILLDGIPLRTIPRNILANSMAMVEQETLLFKGSLRENLTLWDATTSAASVQQACRDAEIEGVIDALPEGYASELLEGAANLSGGQRQRVEIARALATDPSILIMDEATSALDAETELTIDRNIRARGCTSFIVAHRLSTVRDSDVIVVLDEGKVVERGSHDELMRGCGRYAQLLAEDLEINSDRTIDGMAAL